MALPSSGQIWFSDVNTELGQPTTATITLNDSAVRSLFQVSSGYITMLDGYGKSSVQYWVSKVVPNSSGTRIPLTWTCAPYIANDGSVYLGGSISDGSANPRGFILSLNGGGAFVAAKKIVPAAGYEFNTAVLALMGAAGGRTYGFITANPNGIGQYEPLQWTVNLGGQIIVSTRLQDNSTDGYQLGGQVWGGNLPVGRVAGDPYDSSGIIPWRLSNSGGGARFQLFSSSGIVDGTQQFSPFNALPTIGSANTYASVWAIGSNETITQGFPQTANGQVYCAGQSSNFPGYMNVFRFEDTKNTSPTWTTTLYQNVYPSDIAASANTVYVTGVRGGSIGYLAALNASDGSIKWVRTMPHVPGPIWKPSVTTWSNSMVAGVSIAIEANNFWSNSVHGTTVFSFNEANGEIFSTKTFHYANSSIKLSPMAIRAVGDKTVLVLAHNSAQGIGDGNTAGPLVVKFSTYSNADITAANGAIAIDGQSLYINAMANTVQVAYNNTFFSTTTVSSYFSYPTLYTNNNGINNANIDTAFSTIVAANTYTKIL